ncbi:MAG TPA: hypothetical protein VKR56_14985 [Candidatus Cybelea sp.]|nr:hypothetical protein [Candidatus Cybelea sp.]
MISGRYQRRRRALLWSALASVAVHAVLLSLLFWAVAYTFVQRGAKETVTATTTVTIQKPPPATPAPAAPRHPARVVVPREAAPAHAPLRELAKIVPIRAPLLPRHSSTISSKIERDQAGFAQEVAQLNKANDPRAIPTIDPGSQESATKDYAFTVPSALRGDPRGNGIITPTRHWRDNGLHCYYARYEFTNPDGSEEDGEIVWPFCFDPGADPFMLPPHRIPFPFPRAGFKLPADALLPPQEKAVYEEWLNDPGLSSP